MRQHRRREGPTSVFGSWLPLLLILAFIESALAKDAAGSGGARWVATPSHQPGGERKLGGSPVLRPGGSRPIPSSSSSAVISPSDNKDAKVETRFSADFLLRDQRMGFIRKVYLTLTVQLLLTGAICAWTGMHRRELRRYFFAGDGTRAGILTVTSAAVTIGSMLAMASSRQLRRGAAGYGLTALFTTAESVMVAFLTLMYTAKSVTAACVQTAAATAGLTLYAFQSNPKYDLTGVGSALSTSLFCLIGFGILRLFLHVPLLDAAYSTLGALLMSAFIVYDTYTIIGGKHRRADQMDSKDHLMGALQLYMDIVNLFIHLLQLLGERE